MLVQLRPVVAVSVAVLVAGLVAGACDGDDDGDTANTGGPGTSASATGSGSGSGSGTAATTVAPDTGGSESPADSTGAAESTEEGTPDTGGSSTGMTNTCDPVVPGEWNACMNEDGTIDNTLCNWTGLPGSTGFIGCLNAPKMAGNVCMISDCEDDCDCFAPAATGDAAVVCAEILKGGGTACVLSCADGQTCPDTMECIGGTCFHPNAPR